MFKDYSLYLIISEEYGKGRSAVEIARTAIAGGVDIVQMREKHKSMQELIVIGKDLAALCKSKAVTFIVNDDPSLARRVGADGVHLGQDDAERFSIAAARDIMGPNKIIGLSASTRDQVEKANGLDIDYIGFGPVFPTTVKENPVGTSDIEYVTKITKKPVFFIGGIDMSNIDEILRRGGRNVAVIRGIVEAEDIEASARQYRNRLRAQQDLVRA